MRVVKGTAVYTSAFTPPTAPSTAITNTEALLSFTNAAMLDQSGKANVETYGNAQLDTSVKKFGTASAEFDGTGDILTIRNILPIGTAAFTVEFFMKTNTTSLEGGAYRRVFRTGTSNVATTVTEVCINSGSGTGYGNTTNLFIYTGSQSTKIIGTSNIADNNWHHVAIARDSSNNYKLFVDGTQEGSTQTSFANDLSQDDYMLGTYNGASGMYVGYVDELRITLGKARYTSNFTAPTKEFPNL